MNKPVNHTRRALVLAAAASLALSPLGAAAQGLTKIRFSLDWKFEGQTAFFHMAKAKGYFEQEGLDVTIDSGNGSAAAMTRIASGAYDIALGDVSSLIEFSGNNPGPVRMQAVYQLYDDLPLAYFALKKSGIKSIGDFSGKSIASANFEVTKKLFPMFAKATRIDPASVKWVTIDPSLRVNMVLKGDAEICGGFLNAMLEFNARGIKSEDVVVMKVSDLGIRAYGNAVIASSKLINENPKAVAGFVRATNRAFREALADPAASIKFLKAREPLVDEALELQRFTMMIPAMLTARSYNNGLGAINKLVLDNQVDDVSATFKTKVKPNPDVIFNSSFLQAKADRMPIK
jgi:NitT/TauT family transport system substrate-binding protein